MWIDFHKIDRRMVFVQYVSKYDFLRQPLLKIFLNKYDNGIFYHFYGSSYALWDDSLRCTFLDIKYSYKAFRLYGIWHVYLWFLYVWTIFHIANMNKAFLLYALNYASLIVYYLKSKFIQNRKKKIKNLTSKGRHTLGTFIGFFSSMDP